MINPNKTYRAKETGTVLRIIPNSPGYWFEIELQGQKFEGFLRDGETNYKKLSPGDKVRIGVE